MKLIKILTKQIQLQMESYMGKTNWNMSNLEEITNATSSGKKKKLNVNKDVTSEWPHSGALRQFIKLYTIIYEKMNILE